MNQLSSLVSFVYLSAFVVQGFKDVHHKNTKVHEGKQKARTGSGPLRENF
jgi:hypothetical protein